MSTYMKMTLNPKTDKFELAVWHDDYYGKHHYGVEFPDGTVVDPREVELETIDAVSHDSQRIQGDKNKQMDEDLKESLKPTKEQLIAVLQNLQSSMMTAGVMMSKCGHEDHSEELGGAIDIVRTWIEGINDDTD